MPVMIWFLSHGSYTFGGAKPVPVNSSKFKNYVRGDLIVSAAGVATNLMLALVCSVIFVVLGLIAGSTPAAAVPVLDTAQRMMVYGIWLNLVLCFFNLIPVPPLDGSHLLYHALPPRAGTWYRDLRRFGYLPLFVLLFLLGFMGSSGDGELDVFVALLLSWIYKAYFEAGKKQGSWAKQRHGVKVVMSSGARLTLRAASIRWLAWIGWRAIIWSMFVPAWDRKVRLLADWLLTACLGRDVVNPRIEGRHEVSQAWFDPGQVILAPGEPSLFHYVVQMGEVEVLTDGATETLRAGAVFCDDLSTERRATVRARNRVRLLAVEKRAAAAVM
jgi:Zn-dependent protease